MLTLMLNKKKRKKKR